jgi:hypothetical protein
MSVDANEKRLDRKAAEVAKGAQSCGMLEASKRRDAENAERYAERESFYLVSNQSDNH